MATGGWTFSAVKIRFTKSQYPAKLIDKRIAKIRKNNFEPKNKTI